MLLATILFVLLVAVFRPASVPAAGSSVYHFYYFNPDSPQSNLARLKREMDSLFSHTGLPVAFQPFAHLIDFDDKLQQNSPHFVLLPHWYLREHGRTRGLRPLLMPVADGKVSYRKVLLAGAEAGIALPDISGRSLAMTTLGPNGEQILRKLLFTENDLVARDLSIVVVPKDADALFALALGHVDLALVSRNSLKTIGALNPKILAAVTPLAETAPIPMPVICYDERIVPAAAVQKLLEIFQDPRYEDERQTVMELMQIDEWQKFYN